MYIPRFSGMPLAQSFETLEQKKHTKTTKGTFDVCQPLNIVDTLQGINISHLGKRKIIFKICHFLGDMLVPRRVNCQCSCGLCQVAPSRNHPQVHTLGSRRGDPKNCENGMDGSKGWGESQQIHRVRYFIYIVAY